MDVVSAMEILTSRKGTFSEGFPHSLRKILKTLLLQSDVCSLTEATVPDSWVNRYVRPLFHAAGYNYSYSLYRKATQAEQRAAAVIQQSFRAHLEVRMERALAPGTSENEQTLKAISASVELLQSHLETLAVTVFT